MGVRRKLRYGMVGGGPGGFIGSVHRRAAALDGTMELVAGAFSSSAEKSRAQGAALRLDPRRVYGSYQEMAEAESRLPEGERIDFVAIATPNYLHYDIAKIFIEAGFHVLCDKPLTVSVEEAEHLCSLVRERKIVFGLTHNYSGYPMVKQARELVRTRVLGDVRKVVVEYSLGRFAAAFAQGKISPDAWRLHPDKAGISSTVADIGTHAEHLARYITGLEIVELCSDLTTFVPGHRLEDDANILLRYDGGAKGILFASKMSVGEENNLSIRVYGSEASLAWRQEEPDTLRVRYADKPEQVYTRGHECLAPIARWNCRLPVGHPEGFIEAFANIYRNFGRTVAARLAGETPNEYDLDFPTVADGAIGVNFIHRCVESARLGAWVDARYAPPA